jgi:hypothetical protein
VEPGAASRPEILPNLQRMRGLLEAVVAIGSGLDLESTLRRIVETAVGLVDATYGALGVIGEGKRLAEFIPVGLTQDEIARIHHWPQGRGLLGLLIDDPARCAWPTSPGTRTRPASPTGTRRCTGSSASRSGSATRCSATCT